MTTTLTIYDITCTIFITSHALYMTSHLLCMVSHSLCVTSHNDSIYDIKHYMFMTYSLDMASCTVLWPHNHCVPSQPLCLTLHSVYFWHYTQCTNFMKRSVCMSSQPLYVSHHMYYIWHHIHSLWHHTSLFMTSSPLYLKLHTLYLISSPLYLCNHTLSMISQPPYIWYHIQYTCDILSTIFMTSYPLCMTTQHYVFLIPHSAYVWHHLHYRWYHIHSITQNHSIYDVTSTSVMISHPPNQTSHPLYLCHHNLSTDIIPTFVWHHTHYMCDIRCTLYNIISTP